MGNPGTQVYEHNFRRSLGENGSLETQYFESVVSPRMVGLGLDPVDLRGDPAYYKPDIDFAGRSGDKDVHTIEAKFDNAAGLTGNVFFETVSSDDCNGAESQAGCFWRSEAEFLHQIVVMQNKVYVSRLEALRDYWYEGLVPRVFGREFVDKIKHRVPVRNRDDFGRVYNSYGECIATDLLFSEAYPHHRSYLVEVFPLPEEALKVMVPHVDNLLSKRWGERWTAFRPSCPKEVRKWLV
ncbi:MAG: hypothetical protein JSS66_07555 [Armatimonadetes bacterium]|nr:hypothetical protein [Armatimonadota bacterium]